MADKKFAPGWVKPNTGSSSNSRSFIPSLASQNSGSGESSGTHAGNVNNNGTRLAPLGRKFATGLSGKLTEQANLYQQQQIKSPSHAGKKKTYSRSALLELNKESSMPEFPKSMPSGLMVAYWQSPASAENLDTTALFTQWQVDIERRARRSSNQGNTQNAGGGRPPQRRRDGGNHGQSANNSRGFGQNWRGNKPDNSDSNWGKWGDNSRQSSDNKGRWDRSGSQDKWKDVDDSTFHNYAAPSSFGLESMAAAADKFAKEMEAQRLGLQVNEDALKPSFFETDNILDEALEEGLDCPPEEEVVTGTEAIDIEDMNALSIDQPGETQSSTSSSYWPSPSRGVQAPSMPSAQNISNMMTQQNPLMMSQQPPPGIPQPNPGPPPAWKPEEWYYQDPQGQVQGPFKSEEMREWFEHQFFGPQLMIRRGVGEPFMPLGRRFPNLALAFKPENENDWMQQLPQMSGWGAGNQNPILPPEKKMQHQMFEQKTHDQVGLRPGLGMDTQRMPMGSQMYEIQAEQARMLEERKRLEEQQTILALAQQREQERLEQQRIALQKEKERQIAEEALRLKEAEEARRRAAEEENQRMIEEERRRIAEEEHRRAIEEERRRAAEEAEQQRIRKEAEEQARKAEEQRIALELAEKRRKAEEKPAWGGVTPAKNIQKKMSLTEIQQLELKQAQMKSVDPNSLAQRISTSAGSVVHGGNASAPMSTGGNTTLENMSVDLRKMLGVKGSTTPTDKATAPWAAQAQTPSQAPVKSLKQIQEEEARRLRQQQVTQPKSSNLWASKVNPSAGAAPVSKPQTASPKQNEWSAPVGGSGFTGAQSSSAEANDFGGNSMSTSMRKWCETEISKVGGTMTLIEFIYTLESSSDIREYLRDYLGSTPQVSAFATEFIRRKTGNDSKDEAQSAVTGDGFIPAVSKKKKKNARK